MKANLQPFILVVALFAAVMVAVGVSRVMAPKELIPWRNGFAAARAESASSGKPVFAYFTASWCGPCQAMKDTTWANAGVEEALREYVPVKVDVDEQSKVAMEYGAQSIPKFTVLDAEGNVVKSTEGYMNPEEFLEWLRG
jgi:thiol:disulfide interchange protein